MGETAPLPQRIGAAWRLVAAACICAGLLPAAAFAQAAAEDQAAPEPEAKAEAESEDDAETGTDAEATGEEPKAKLTVVPVPIVDPTVGNGLALVALYTFPSPGAENGEPRSTLGIGAAYTDTKSYAIAAGGSVHLRDDRVRLAGSAAFADVNLSFYGIGGNSPLADNPVPLNVHGWFANMAAKVRIARRLYVGAAFKILDGTLEVERPIRELPALTASYRQLALGPVAEYDSRDNSWWPLKGAVLSAQYIYYTEFEPFFEDPLGIGGSFGKFDAKGSSYFGLTDDLVIAGQVRGAVAGDDTPFFFLPSISLRGFPGGRYLDSFVLQGQAEMRWKFARRFGMVAFGGIGVIAAHPSDLENGVTAVGYGVGVRYLLSEADRMNAGLDIAFGGEGATLYFRVGEAF